MFFAMRKTFPQGVASKNPELILDSYSSPTAFELLRSSRPCTFIRN